MQINPHQLTAIIPYEEISAKLKFSAAVAITRRHFCSQMNVNNLCSKVCSNCAVNITAAFKGIGDAKDPSAMYVTRLRHEFASVAENQPKQQPKEDSKKDRLGLEIERADLFEELLLGVS